MRRISLLLVLNLLFLPVLGHALTGDKRQPAHIEADSVSIDDSKGISVYQGKVSYTQGTIMLRADSITVYTTPDGKHRERELLKVIAVGNLAHFRQVLDGTNEEMRAEAQRIEYFPNDERASFQGAAHLWKAGNEFAGNVIDYDGRAATVKAAKAADGGGRVQVILQPRRQEEPAGGTPP